jgi:shikimate dehydrogenase
MHTFILQRLGVPCSYEKVSVPPEAFASRAEELFRTYDGFCVTIPFKAEIIPYLKELRGDAPAFGAVNTVRAKERAGYNTDGFGFLLMLENAGVSVKGKTVLLLGAGGAGRSCVKKLTEAGASVSVYERNAERLRAVYEELGGFTPLGELPCKPFDVAINCTGIGMHDTVGISPAPRELLAQCGVAVDLIYVPAESEFLRLAREAGKRTVNGAAMLFYQAYYGDCIFLERQPDADEARELWLKYSEENG